MKLRTLFISVVAVLAVLAVTPFVAAQGGVTPPGQTAQMTLTVGESVSFSITSGNPIAIPSASGNPASVPLVVSYSYSLNATRANGLLAAVYFGTTTALNGTNGTTGTVTSAQISANLNSGPFQPCNQTPVNPPFVNGTAGATCIATAIVNHSQLQSATTGSGTSNFQFEVTPNTTLPPGDYAGTINIIYWGS